MMFRNAYCLKAVGYFPLWISLSALDFVLTLITEVSQISQRVPIMKECLLPPFAF